MANKKQIKKVHPVGEEEFEFPVGCGTVRLKATEDVLTPYGGLVPWAAFLTKAGIVGRLARSCPLERTSPNATRVGDVVNTFLLAAVCDGRRFAHINRLREDGAAREVLGMERICGDDTVRRFLGSLEEKAGAEWVAKAAQTMWSALPKGGVILDWDSTVQTKYGKQEGAEVGYNPQKRGRRSFHPLMAVAAGTRLCTYYRFRSGETVTASEWAEAEEESAMWLGPKAKVWLHRGDRGLGTEKVMAWHEGRPEAPHYLFKLKMTRGVRRAMAAVPEDQWRGRPGGGVLQVAEAQVQLHGWSRPRRVVFGRRLLGVIPAAEAGAFWDQSRHEVEAYATDLGVAEAEAWQVVELYRQRGDAENVFDELKNQWGFNGFTSRRRVVSSMAARLLLLAYNLWNLFMRLMVPSRHVEAASGRRWFLLIAARLTKSGRKHLVQVSTRGRWWRLLIEGYKRLLLWISLTAPQLDDQHDDSSKKTLLSCQLPAPYCGI